MENISVDKVYQAWLLHFHDDLPALTFARMKNNGTARGRLNRGAAAMRVALKIKFLAPEFLAEENRRRQGHDA